MATKTVEIHKLKLAELRQEYFAHGLETKGTKQDLIHRLQKTLGPDSFSWNEEHIRKNNTYFTQTLPDN
uniref:SAP domain-containing protein n=1 Tax=Piliocolobus tephrosceles TaxID=591936 RepID=A0A8C9GEA7_9PRIM